MAEYLAPGIYLEEAGGGPRPIEGVSTSTAGFVGQTERGPQEPRLVTSWQEYASWYGTYADRGGTLRNIYLPYAVHGFFDNGGRRLFIARVTGPGSGTAAAALPGDPDVTTLSANGPGAWGNNIRLVVTPSSAANAAPEGSPVKRWFRLLVVYYRDGIADDLPDPTDPAQMSNPHRIAPDMFEEFDDLSPVAADSNFAGSVINANSKLVVVEDCRGTPRNTRFTDRLMQGGSTVEATRAEYVGASMPEPQPGSGLSGLAQISEISIIGIPDEVLVEGLTDAVVDLCEKMKDRFGVVSEGTRTADAVSIFPPRDTAYAACYYPWLRVPAPHRPEGDILAPPIGHVAGIFARVDAERGVHKAPANEVVRGLMASGGKEPLEFTVTKAQQDILNPKGVNVIRDLHPAEGDVRVWGARTMSSDPQWRYVNSRRLLLFVEQSIVRGTQWVVFEPNFEGTWSTVRLSIRTFLRTLWRDGALLGTTEDEAFFLKCDRTTMTQDDVANGRLICLIGIALLKPAEFVIFRITQKTMEAQS